MEALIDCPHCWEENKIYTDNYDQVEDLRHLCRCCDEMIAFGLELKYVAIPYETLPLREVH